MTAPKEVPWVVGLIAATLAWTLTHIVDRLTSAPLISYELQEPVKIENGPDGKPIASGSFLVRNLTRETVFNHAHFQIYAGSAANPQGTFEAVDGGFIFPGEGFQATINPVREGGEFVLTYDLPEMQPHQAWRINFSGLGVKSPALSLRMGSPPNLGEPPPPPAEDSASPPASPAPSPSTPPGPDANKSGETIRAVQLVPADWQTMLVEKELPILALSAIGFAVLLLLCLLFLRVPDGNPPPGNDRPAPDPPPVKPAAPASAAATVPASELIAADATKA